MATKIKLIADNVITTSQIDTSSLDSHFTGGTGVTYSSGTISIGQAVATTDNVTFADLTVTGNLNITGDINSYNITDLDVTDQTITLGAGQIEANSGGSGIIVAGSEASILWDENNDEWDFNKSINVLDGLSVENGKLTINEFTSPSAFTQIRKTNTGSNLAIVSQESIYMLLDENNDQTNRAFFIEHGAGSPGTGTTVFKVEESGNVGIGTSSPVAILEVESANATGDTARFGTSSSDSAGNFKLALQTNDANRVEFLATRQASTGGSLDIYTRAVGGVMTNALTIDESQNVGIGTPSPTSSLDVNGVVSLKGNDFLDSDTNSHYIKAPVHLYLYSNATDLNLAINSNGNVGIGKQTPTDRLQVIQDTGNDRSIIVAESTVAGSAEAGIAVRNTSGEGRFAIGGADHIFIENAVQGKDLYFATYPTGGSETTERARIHAGGGLSIGTSNIPASTAGALVLANGGAGGPSSTQPNGGLWIEDASGVPQLTLYRASGNALRLDGQGSGTLVFDNSGSSGYQFVHSSTTIFEINEASSGKVTTYIPIEAAAANDHFKSGVFYNVGENPINNPWHTCTQVNSSGASGGTADCGACVSTSGTITGCSQGTGSAYNWYSAKRYCELAGMRLCTRAEITAGATAGSGCQHDTRGIWTSTKGTTDSNKYFIVQGDASTEQENYPYNTTITGFSTNEIGIRCCQQNSWS